MIFEGTVIYFSRI